MVFGKHINRYYLKYAPMLLMGVLVLIVEDWMMLLIPRFYQMVVNGINQGFVDADGLRYSFDMTFLLDKICLPMVAIILALTVGRFLWRVLFLGVAIRTERGLRDSMFSRAECLSRQFYDRNKVGSLMSLFTNDLDTVQECVGWGLVMLADAAIMGTMAIVKMWQMDPVLTGLSLVPMGLLLACATVVGRYMTKKWDQRQEAFSRLSDFSQESISGLSVIKAFVKEAAQLLTFRKCNEENERTNIDHTKASVLLKILVTLFVESVIGIILGYGGYLVYIDKFNAGQLVEFIGYFVNIVFPVMSVSELIDMTSRGKASLDRIGKLLDAHADVDDAPDAKAAEQIRGDIEVKHLSFRYPDAQYDALQDISFKVKAGQSVGIAGRTGAGKTTLAQLLLRAYNVPDGTVFIDGSDVNTLKIRDVRGGISYVPQDNFLFSDTIANNISFGAEGDVSAAAKAADVHDNISQFAQGYETVLGERGVTVSGGQKQRISIARALLRNAPVLIMDDSVSAVDTATEKTILDNLREDRRGKTTILIAHRISTIADMDLILFLEDGRLLDAGTHAELLERCTAYRKTVKLQQLEAEGGAQNA